MAKDILKLTAVFKDKKIFNFFSVYSMKKSNTIQKWEKNTTNINKTPKKHNKYKQDTKNKKQKDKHWLLNESFKLLETTNVEKLFMVFRLLHIYHWINVVKIYNDNVWIYHLMSAIRFHNTLRNVKFNLLFKITSVLYLRKYFIIIFRNTLRPKLFIGYGL